MTGACGAAAGGNDIAGPSDFARAGIAVARLQALSITPTVRAVGEVLDPTRAIKAAGEIARANALVAGAKAKVDLEVEQQGQAEALYQRHVLALAQLQKAEQDLANSQSALAVNRANRSALLARTEAEWGPAMAAALRTNGDPLPQLATGKAMLVGLSLRPGENIPDPPATAESEADGIQFELHLIGRVPTMIGAYPGEGILYQADAQPGIPVGASVSASLPHGAKRTGVLVPASAVTWQAGRSIVFRLGPHHGFEPVPVATDVPTHGGYLVTAELSPGDSVVVQGASLLLAAGSHPKPDADGD